jgi:hypothetical protein
LEQIAQVPENRKLLYQRLPEKCGKMKKISCGRRVNRQYRKPENNFLERKGLQA